MSRPSGNRAQPKDMYWFAHGGLESSGDKCVMQKSTHAETEEESGDSNPSSLKSVPERRTLDDQKTNVKDLTDGACNMSLPSLERDDRLRASDKRIAVEERKKQLWEAEQERNDAVLRKRLERDAASEARRNAQRSTIAFAFGSSIPRNVDSLQGDGDKVSRQPTTSGFAQKEENHDIYQGRRSISPLNHFLIDDISPRSHSSQSNAYSERKAVSPPCWLVGSGALIGDDMMTRSMTSAVAPRGRRKNDLMPTVPYERATAPKTTHTSTTRKRSVSMTRLDQLAQPRKHYLEATKASSSSGGVVSNTKDTVRSPTRPLSSASEQSGGSGKRVVHRVRSSPRKPRPITIAGTLPELKKTEPTKKTLSPVKKTIVGELKKAVQSTVKLALSKPEKPKSAEKNKLSPKATSTPKTTKQPTKATPAPRTSTPKTTAAKKSPTNTKKDDILVSVPPEVSQNKAEDSEKLTPSSPSSPTPDNIAAENEKTNGKKIISEEEAKAALAEKRRLAREQAEREIELERLRQEELRQIEEERLRQEEEEQKRMEEEQLRLLEEHRRLEDEKLKKAIEEQERKEEEEKMRREEEQRLKAEQEKKAHEEAEKQRIELEEKLRKEEEERAERKKRLEKIMSRTRGKTSGTSPSGSVSSSDQLDCGDNQQEGFSSGANSLDSNESNDVQSEPTSNEDTKAQTEILSAGNSLEANPTFEVVSETESLNSNDLMMPLSETASQDNSLVIVPDKEAELAMDVAVEEPIIEAANSTENESSNHLINAQEKQFDSTKNDPCNDQITSSQYNQHLDCIEIESLNNQIRSAPDNQQFCYAENESSNNQNVESTSSIYQQYDKEEIISKDIDEIENAVNEKNINEIPEIISETFSNESENVKAEEILYEVKDHESENLKAEEILYEVHGSENVKAEEILCEVKDHDSNVLCMPEGDNFQKLDSSDSHEQSMVIDTEINNGLKELNSCVDYPDEQNILNKTTEDKCKLQSEVVSFVVSEGNARHIEEFPHSFEVKNDMLSEFESRVDYEEENEKFNNFSSSDMKLPDPIYETSEDGSLSSEKQQPDFNSFAFQESAFNINNQESNIVSDDVFAEQAVDVLCKEPSQHDVEHQAMLLQEGFSAEDPVFKTDDIEPTINYNTKDAFGFDNSSFTSDAELLGVQSSEGPSQSFQEKEFGFYQNTETVDDAVNPLGDEIDNDKENIEHPFADTAISSNPFASQDISFKEYDMHPEKENFNFQSVMPENINTIATESRIVAEETNYEAFPSTLENSDFNQFQSQGSNKFDVIQQDSFFTSEQTKNFEMPDPCLHQSEAEHLSNLTFVKAEGGENCIGIISSVDHDQMINDFPKTGLLNEQLKSNFQCASMTDSEDSSLDSNLSQVMTVEMGDNEVLQGLNNGTDVQKAVNGISKGQPELISQNTYNGDSILKPNGNHFSATDIFSNGHRVESPEQLSGETGRFSTYVPLDGKDISSVDNCKSNMFDNVDAYGKVSPDPFLAKGTSNQIPGNPFLLQDDQKQVLMTPDFFN